MFKIIEMRAEPSLLELYRMQAKLLKFCI